MTGRIVHQPKPQHHCDPPDQDTSKVWRHDFGPHFGGVIEGHPWVAAGTVWQCDCGQRWRATYPYVNVFAPTWTKVRTPRPRRSPLLARLGIRPRRT